MGIFFSLTKYTAISAIVYLLLKDMLEAFPMIKPQIAFIANRDLTYVGCYDEILAVSVEYWIYAIIANAYGLNTTTPNYNKALGVLSEISLWLKNDIYDPEGIIENSTLKASKKIQDRVEAYNKEKAKDSEAILKLKVSPDYDYHNVPSDFKCNDYLNYEALLNRLDSMEVKS